MNDVFTIVSLFIAVSGATYAALTSLREWFHEKFKAAYETAHTQQSTTINDAKGNALRQAATDRFNSMKKWDSVAAGAYVVPLVFFFLSAYAVAVHVLCEYWADPTVPGNSCWKIYKWGLLVLIIIDGLSILLTLVAYFAFKRYHAYFKECVAQAEEQKINVFSAPPNPKRR